MLVEELEAFMEVITSFEKLGISYADDIKKLGEYRKEQEQIQSSEKKSFGFFTKTSKEEMLKTLDEKIGRLESISSLEKKLIALIAHVIHKHEIGVIKARKRARFEEILREFAISRLKKLEKETEFWGKLLESDDGYEYSSEVLHSYLRTHNLKPTSSNQEEPIEKNSSG